MAEELRARPVAALCDIEKSYGGRRVLGPVRLEVRSGELLVLRGPNGAGKSTLLSILAGVTRPDAGERRIDPSVRDRVSLVPQELSLYEALTCAENLKFWGLACGLPPRAIRARTAWLLRELGLEEKLRAPAGSLSGGMKRRLHLATALMDTPGLLLLDEPTVGADDGSAAAIAHMLRHFKAQGTAIVMATHLPRDLEGADRAVTLKDGLIVKEDAV